MKRFITILILFIVVSGCEEDPVFIIDEELIAYVNLFEQEAALRGMQYNVANMNVNIRLLNIDERGVLGQCTSYVSGDRAIMIDRGFWRNLNALDREYLMMHELGHCVLERVHQDASDATGSCLSIMQSGLGDCSKHYNNENRERLLDELFSL